MDDTNHQEVNTQSNPYRLLTRREVEVLMQIVEGRSSKEVAQSLFVSKRTVDFHLANIYQKLNVNNRVQAFRKASALGLIPISVTRAEVTPDSSIESQG